MLSSRPSRTYAYEIQAPIKFKNSCKDLTETRRTLTSLIDIVIATLDHIYFRNIDRGCKFTRDHNNHAFVLLQQLHAVTNINDQETIKNILIDAAVTAYSSQITEANLATPSGTGGAGSRYFFALEMAYCTVSRQNYSREFRNRLLQERAIRESQQHQNPSRTSAQQVIPVNASAEEQLQTTPATLPTPPARTAYPLAAPLSPAATTLCEDVVKNIIDHCNGNLASDPALRAAYSIWFS